jgi:hypothetical protein
MDHMKPVKIVLLVLAVVLSAGLVLADSIPDPFIKLGGGGGTGDIIVPNFIITSPNGTSPATPDHPEGTPCILTQLGFSETEPDCVFANHIFPRAPIFQLTFDIFGVDAGTVNCSLIEGSPFSQCSVSGGEDFTRVIFFDGIIPHGAEFSLVVGGFPANTEFNGTVAVPEPGTITLFLVGLGTLLARRRSLTR